MENGLFSLGSLGELSIRVFLSRCICIKTRPFVRSFEIAGEGKGETAGISSAEAREFAKCVVGRLRFGLDSNSYELLLPRLLSVYSHSIVYKIFYIPLYVPFCTYFLCIYYLYIHN